MPNYIVRLKVGQKVFDAKTWALNETHAEMKAQGAALKKFPGENVAVVGCMSEDLSNAVDSIFGKIFK